MSAATEVKQHLLLLMRMMMLVLGAVELLLLASHLY